jgi:subfamily B ATP-binding cassette protein MsbA
METYKRLWPYARRYLKWTLLAIICTLLVSSTSGLTAWLVKPVLDGIFVKRDGSLLVLLSIAVMLVYLAKGVFTYLQSFLIQKAALHVIRDIRNDLYSHIIYLPLDEYQKSPTGKLISNMMNDVGQLSRLLANVIKDSLQQSFTIAGLVTVAFIRNWRLASVAVVLFPLAGFFISKYGKRMRRISRRAQQNIALLSGGEKARAVGDARPMPGRPGGAGVRSAIASTIARPTSPAMTIRARRVCGMGLPPPLHQSEPLPDGNARQTA